MSVGPDFSETHVLSDGTHVVLRHIRPEDADVLRRGFDHLQPASRYHRFHVALSRLSDEAVRYLTQVDGRDHVAIVATGESLDLKSDVGLGVARFVRLRDEPTVAEAAVTVVDEAQRKGLGRLLAATIARAAIERGVRMFRAEVLADNEPMVAILREAGAIERARDGAVVTYDVPLETIKADLEGPLHRFLRTAATSVEGLVKLATFAPGPPPGG